MIIPRYWSEATAKELVGTQHFTIRRFGWSDADETQAKQHAEARLAEALVALHTNGDIRRVDHKVPYNGAEGIPIREEIVQTHGETVISRNSYGALCLNTADVFFADVDFADLSRSSFGFLAFIVLIGLSALAAVLLGSAMLLWVGALIAALWWIVGKRISALRVRLEGGPEKMAMTRIEAVSKRHPDLHLRIYRTPLGLRVLLMNDTYAAASERAQTLLQELGTDPVYVQMCRNQHCFRARVSPKPWRIGLSRKTVTGVWPVHADRLKDRDAWVSAYERRAGQYASCHFVSELGSRTVSAEAEHVRRIHDHLCRSHDTRLELA